jgi:P4 family phage/plasmid primase-like protien
LPKGTANKLQGEHMANCHEEEPDSQARLQNDFGRALYQGFYEVIVAYIVNTDKEKGDDISYQIVAVLANVARSIFHIFWHTQEQSFFMYTASERVYLPVDREQLINNGFAIFTRAHEAVLVAKNAKWSLIMAEKTFRAAFKEGLRAYRGETNGISERNLLLFQNNTVDLNALYSADNLAPDGKLFSGRVPDHTFFHTHTLNASLVPVMDRPPLWERACILMGFDSPEMMSAMEDILLYLLSPSLGREEMFYLYGKGSNGKSVLIKFLTAVIGTRHTASVSLDELQDSSFAWHILMGKRLNLPSESGTAYVESEKLKAALTGDQITINRKNKDYVSVTLAVKFVFAMNRQPVFSERTHAIYRRFRMVVFNREVEEHEKIADFHNVLLDHRDEIVSWCLINHLRRYGKFTPKFDLPEIFETWRQDALQGEADPIVLFVEECLVFIDDPSIEVDIAQVRLAFKTFCQGNSIDTRKWSDVVIGRKLSDEFGLIAKHNPAARHAARGSQKKTRHNQQKRVYEGLRLLIGG